MNNSRTQIIATIGPASKEEAILESMMASCMDVVRLNFSWGTHEEHAHLIQLVRVVAQRLGRRIPIIADLSGPRVQQGDGHMFGGSEGESVITEKDRKDLEFVLGLDVEYVAMSYVGSAQDIVDLKKIIRLHKGRAKVVAKIERVDALENLKSIIKQSDAVMIARGDLGDAIAIEKVPFVQDRIIKQCNRLKKPVIVATEMMPSMIKGTRPSRSDVTDVAYAVLLGADAVMLSNETAIGDHPVEVVTMMEQVVQEAEKHDTRRKTYTL